jgi:hypothetical protein
MDQHATFTLFSRLPTELRQEIWKLTLDEPRLIPASVHARDLCPAMRQYFIPCPLQTCRESRKSTLYAYTVCRIQVQRETTEGTADKIRDEVVAYFNPSEDILQIGDLHNYLTPTLELSSIPAELINAASRIVSHEYFESGLWGHIKRFTKLEEYILVRTELGMRLRSGRFPREPEAYTIRTTGASWVALQTNLCRLLSSKARRNLHRNEEGLLGEIEADRTNVLSKIPIYFDSELPASEADVVFEHLRQMVAWFQTLGSLVVPFILVLYHLIVYQVMNKVVEWWPSSPV